MENMKKYVAEFIGTLVLVLFACGTAAVVGCNGADPNAAYLMIDESPEAEAHLWHVRQIFLDEEDAGDFRIEADVDLDATQEQGEVIFRNYRVGFVEDLAE